MSVVPLKHRHERFAALSVAICAECIQAGHVHKFGIRYPVQAREGEPCTCKCHVRKKAA